MASTKISALPNIASPALTDTFAVVQSGVTYQETVTQLQSLLSLSSVSIDGLQNQQYTYITDTGAADAYVATVVPAITVYTAGQRFNLLIANTNTGAATLNVSGLGTKNIKRMDGTDPVAGDILLNQIATFVYDGTQFQLLNPITLSDATATTLTFSPSTGGIVGTTTNDDADAGNVGEIVESTVLVGAAVSLTTATDADITSISLSAGDWDVWGLVSFSPAGTTTISSLIGWISSTSATLPTSPNEGAISTFNLTFTTGATQDISVGMKRISVAGATTVYLSAQATFLVSTMDGYGYIGARRVR